MNDWHYPVRDEGISVVDAKDNSVAVCADGPTARLIVELMNREQAAKEASWKPVGEEYGALGEESAPRKKSWTDKLDKLLGFKEPKE